MFKKLCSFTPKFNTWKLKKKIETTGPACYNTSQLIPIYEYTLLSAWHIWTKSIHDRTKILSHIHSGGDDKGAKRATQKKKSPSPCYTKLKMIYFHAFAGSTTGWFLVGMNETFFEWMDGGKVGRRRRAGQGGFAAALWEQIIIKRCTRVEEGKTANIKIKLSSYKNLHYWFEVLTCALLST